jgi:hypothetical protein
MHTDRFIKAAEPPDQLKTWAVRRIYARAVVRHYRDLFTHVAPAMRAQIDKGGLDPEGCQVVMQALELANRLIGDASIGCSTDGRAMLWVADEQEKIHVDIEKQLRLGGTDVGDFDQLVEQAVAAGHTWTDLKNSG